MGSIRLFLPMKHCMSSVSTTKQGYKTSKRDIIAKNFK